jgi:hypothetical protein
MVSVSRIILLQSSRLWRACENASDPAFRGCSRKLGFGWDFGKSRMWNAQPLKGRLISKKNGIAEAMP